MPSASQSIHTEGAVPRILVVDDMPDNLFLMNGLLEDRYEIVTASSGREALDVVMSEAPPDMVLLDIMMPDMDGYEVLRRIRQHAPTAGIPVIFVTALASPQDARLGLDLGAIDYVTKPIDPEKIIERVEAHVTASLHARRMEELCERLSRHLPPAEWQRLFNGPDMRSIRFEEATATVMHAQSSNGTLSRSLVDEIEWLVTRYGGFIDPHGHGTLVAYFADPSDCIRTATELQRSCPASRLSIGVHTGSFVIGTFPGETGERCALLGPETAVAAKVAASAATGSIVISPQTWQLVQTEMDTDAAGCLLTEEFFHDSEIPQACLTPAPVAMSSFAGLGLS